MRIASILMVGLLVIVIVAAVTGLVMQHYYSQMYHKYASLIESRVITGYSPISRTGSGLVFTRPVLVFKVCCNGKCRPISQLMTMVPINGTCTIYTIYGAYLDLNNSIIIRIGPIPLPVHKIKTNITHVMKRIFGNGSSLALPLVPVVVEPIPPWSYTVKLPANSYTCMNYRRVHELSSHGEPICVLVPRKSMVKICSQHLIGAYVNSRIVSSTTGCVSVRVQDPTSIIVLMYEKILKVKIESPKKVSISFTCTWNNPALGEVTFSGTISTNSIIHLPPGSICTFNHSIVPTGDILLISKNRVKIEGPGTIYVNATGRS